MAWLLGHRPAAGRGGARGGLEQAAKLGELPFAKAGADAAGIDELAAVVHRQVKRAEAGAKPVGRAKADHHEIPLARDGPLEPARGAAGAVGCVGLLGEDALQPALADLLEELLASLLDVIGEPDRPRQRQ